MRTTVDLDDDTGAAVAGLRREQGIGLSEAVNTLIRRGLKHVDDAVPFQQQTRALGLAIDVSNVADAIEVLEGPAAR
jgi:Arc/MetJ family transcription regulator